MNDKQEGILFTIDCLNSLKYNFDYCLEELIKETKQLQSNWNSLREWLKEYSQDLEFRCYMDMVLDKMNKLESGEK